MSVLHSLCSSGDLAGVQRVLGGRAGVRLSRDELGRTALHLACSAGHAHVVHALLQAAAPLERDLPDAAGCTALQRAAADGHDHVVKMLIEAGVQLDRQDQVHGNTALHEASWKGYSRTVKILAEAGANLQLSNSGGFTALHLCCQNGHNQSCRELLLAGCEPDLQNNYGDTALHTSARYGHAGVTRILISAQSRVSRQNKNGDTALHIAAAMGRRKLTRVLLEAACDRRLHNHQRETAADIARRKHLTEIVAILESTKPRRSKKDKKDKNKDKIDKSKKPNPTSPHWSPYGCHYYPDSTSFPRPRLDSLPSDPLRSGEQYFLDLAGNIRKGPVGVGYTCYCAPLFKHMEERLDRDKKEIREEIERAHQRVGYRVAGLEHRTRGQLQQLSRTTAADRARCERRHRHLEQWLSRGVVGRHSERAPTTAPPDLATSTLTRSKSLELLDEVHRTALPPAKSLDELGDDVQHDHPPSSHPEPRRTVAEIVASLQGRLPIRYTPDIQWSHTQPQTPNHSESSDDEDSPLRLTQLPGPMRDSNLADPSYENVGLANGGVAPAARTRSGVYSPETVGVAFDKLRLCASDTVDNNDSGYSTRVYGSSKGASPLMGPDASEKTARIGASSLV